MGSRQTRSEADPRIVAGWGADCKLGATIRDLQSAVARATEVS